MKLQELEKFKIGREEQSKINAGLAGTADMILIPAYNPATGQTHMIHCFGDDSCNAAVSFWYSQGYVSSSNPNYTTQITRP